MKKYCRRKASWAVSMNSISFLQHASNEKWLSENDVGKHVSSNCKQHLLHENSSLKHAPSTWGLDLHSVSVSFILVIRGMWYSWRITNGWEFLRQRPGGVNRNREALRFVSLTTIGQPWSAKIVRKIVYSFLNISANKSDVNIPRLASQNGCWRQEEATFLALKEKCDGNLCL